MADKPARGTAVVIGASGLLGRAACRQLVRDGWHVTGVCRHPPTAAEVRSEGFPPMDWVAADRREPASMALLLAAGPEILVDLALDGAQAARALVEACRSGPPTRVVATGTVGEEGIHRRTEAPIPEGAPLDPDDDPHTRGRIEAWEVLQAARSAWGLHFSWAVLPRLWGPGDRSGRDASWVRSILEERVVLLRGDGRARVPDGSAGSAATAVLAGATEPALEGLRYHACGPRDTTSLELVRAAARALGRTARVALVDPKAWASVETRLSLRVDPALPDRDLVLERTALDAAGIGSESTALEGMAESARYLATRPGPVAPRFAPLPEVVEALAGCGEIVEVGRA